MLKYSKRGISTPIAIGSIFVLVFMVGGGFLAYQYQRTEVETENWKTYRNDEYGFEIEYPEDTQVGNLVYIPRGKNITFKLSSTKELEINIFTENPKCPDTTLGSDISNVSINDVNFMKQYASRNYSVVYPYAVAYEYCGMSDGIEYKLVPKIYYSKNQNDPNFVLPDVDNDSVLNQMISTFKFF